MQELRLLLTIPRSPKTPAILLASYDDFSSELKALVHLTLTLIQTVIVNN